MSAIVITEAAQNYLAELLVKQNVKDMGIRIFITQPGTPNAESCLAYCNPGEQQPDDISLSCKDFWIWIDSVSMAFLEDAVVDYATDTMGGQLTIKAPNSKVPMIDENSPMADRINYFLQMEINPGLASHGGHVALVEFAAEEGIAIMRFGGGCQGCSMVDATLKEGVERTLMERIPELKGVRDITDHTERAHAFL